MASKNLNKVSIPKQIKESQSKVTFKVTSVAAKAFVNNKKITKITIGTNVNKIGSQAFKGCTKVKTISINKNVKKIDKMAFYGCKKVSAITIKSKKLTNGTVKAKAFGGMSKKVVYRVPKNKVASYKKLLAKKGAGWNAIVRY